MLFAAATFIISCGSDDSKSGAATTTEPAATDAPATTPAPAATADADKGLELIAQSDCLTCHKVEDKLVGPAYREIANKYPNNAATIDTLASKIIKGGAGNWGQVPMTPHPGISEADAQTMAKYVMSLKQ